MDDDSSEKDSNEKASNAKAGTASKTLYFTIALNILAGITVTQVNKWLDSLKLELPQVILPDWWMYVLDSIKAVIILLSIVAVALIVLPLLRRRGFHSNTEQSDSGVRISKKTGIIIVAFSTCILAAALAMFMLTPIVADSQPEILISTPPANSTSGVSLTVSGTWKNVPDDQHLWLVVWPNSANRYYPQQGPIPLIKTEGNQARGIWSGVVYLGNETGGMNQTYEILPVLADDNANSTFTNFHSEGVKTGSYPGFTDLPSGALAYNHVTVKRAN